jgi:hypothetical protein
LLISSSAVISERMADGAQTAGNEGASPWASPNVANHLTLYADREEIVVSICERLANGEPLAVICRSPGMPSYQTVYEWTAADEKIGGAIAYARGQGYDAIARETIDIVDGRKPDDTGQAPDATRDKARAEIRLKLLAKWDPKRYGDSVQLKHADADGKKLDTAPLIAELLGALGASPAADLAQVLDITPQVKGDK